MWNSETHFDPISLRCEAFSWLEEKRIVQVNLNGTVLLQLYLGSLDIPSSRSFLLYGNLQEIEKKRQKLVFSKYIS